MLKSQRTQERYRKASKGQGTLSNFGFKAPSYPQKVMRKETVSKVVEPESAIVPVAGLSQTRSASILSDPSTDNDEIVSALTEIAEDGQQEPDPASHSQHHQALVRQIVTVPLPSQSVSNASQPKAEIHVKQEELEVELERDEDEIEEEA